MLFAWICGTPSLSRLIFKPAGLGPEIEKLFLLNIQPIYQYLKLPVNGI
jgi:hypothetical protein